MPLRRSVLASLAGEKPGRPQFMRIAQFLGFAASQRHQPSLGLWGDRWSRQATPSDHRPKPVRRSDEPSDGGPSRPGQLQRTTDCPGKSTIYTPVRRGSPAPFAARSTSVFRWDVQVAVVDRHRTCRTSETRETSRAPYRNLTPSSTRLQGPLDCAGRLHDYIMSVPAVLRR